MRLIKPKNPLKKLNSKAVKKVSKGTPLRLVLVVPLVAHIFGAVALVGYLSLKNCHQTVSELANELTDKVSNTVNLHLDTYLATPHQINRLNVNAIKQGLLNLDNSQAAGLYFWQQMQVFDVSHINYGLVTGEFIGANRWIEGQSITIDEVAKDKSKAYSYEIDNQGNRRNVVQVYDDKSRSDAWYTDTVKAGKPIWSQVYLRQAPETTSLSISANYPVYDQNNNIIGVTSSDLLLDDVSKFLRTLKVSASGKAFIIERNGLLVANSSPEKLFTIVNGKPQRLNVLNSTDRTIQSTAQYLQHKFGDFKQIKDSQKLDFHINHEPQAVRVLPWRDKFGLDWLVIVVVPESDFMAQVHANAQVIVVLSLVALLAATSLGLTISRWILQPIHRLSEASQAIAKGDLDQNVEFKSVNELGLLSHSFNQMALQLKESFEQLESRVEERTVELNKAKQSAETANRSKSEFLANMSHELRTPLNAILGFTQVMNRDVSLAPQQQENLGIINRSGEHLLSLINDVLDMSKIEAGRIALSENAFDLYQLLRTIEEMFQLKAESKGLQLLIERTPAVPQYVYADESKLRQILINLLGNAIKFTQEGGVILRVRAKEHERITSPHPQHLIFEVEDTGFGIAPNELEILFEPFGQTETGRKSQQGTGLGLPISRKFVQLMGGDITLSSTPGQGTIFQFDIQVGLAEVADLPERQQRRVLSLEPGQPEYRILVVDDALENRRLLTKLLTPVGFQVREAENGQEAIAVWESWEPHLIWMDMRMPVMNGYEATKEIKSHLQGQATAILALTASILEEEKAIVLGAGCDDFVRKPFREEAIWEKMAQYLGVRYVYAQKDEVGSVKDEKTTSDFILQPSSLQVMPAQWVTQLQYAAIQLDTEQILALITQIPSEHTCLTKALQQKVNDFDFGQILNLTQYVPCL